MMMAECNVRILSDNRGVNTPIRKGASKDNLLLLVSAMESGSGPPTRKTVKPKKLRARAEVPPATPDQRRQLLALAFKVCPNPRPADLLALAQRVQMSASDLNEWFTRRRMLEAWVSREPSLTAPAIASAFDTALGMSRARWEAYRRQQAAEALAGAFEMPVSPRAMSASPVSTEAPPSAASPVL